MAGTATRPLSRSDSSLVKAAWYDTSNDYLVINLQGTNYYYCAFPSSSWSGLKSADSMGSCYLDRIKGNYDCRYEGLVPGY
ncbi:MAG: KTSC domain-containing protein [Actinomycetia bacterium]|nr:KTSC domain-containing protein [Actinomycetes bacterium]